MSADNDWLPLFCNLSESVITGSYQYHYHSSNIHIHGRTSRWNTHRNSNLVAYELLRSCPVDIVVQAHSHVWCNIEKLLLCINHRLHMTTACPVRHQPTCCHRYLATQQIPPSLSESHLNASYHPTQSISYYVSFHTTHKHTQGLVNQHW